MKKTGYKVYGMISGITIILYLVSGFFWGQVAYAMPTVQGFATILLGAAYFLFGVKCSLLVPTELAETEQEQAARKASCRNVALAKQMS